MDEGSSWPEAYIHESRMQQESLVAWKTRCVGRIGLKYRNCLTEMWCHRREVGGRGSQGEAHSLAL